MELARQFFRLVLLGAINHQVTHIIVVGSIFADLRERLEQIHPKLGLLVRCHLCFGTWVASGFIYGHIFTPRLARTIASIFAVASLSDFLQQAYVKAQEMNDQI